MEQITDIVSKEIILRNPQRKSLFRKEGNDRLGYPKQLKNLGFKPKIESTRKDEQITTDVLWHEIRRNVAHYNYRPTFAQTSGTLRILVSFIKEMPDILMAWKYF